MFKFIRVNIYDIKECRELESMLNDGWKIKQMQSVNACEGVIESLFVLYKKAES